jgi:hypothetical protein
VDSARLRELLQRKTSRSTKEEEVSR